MFATECKIKPAFILAGGRAGGGGGGGRMLEPYAAAYIATVWQLPYSHCVPKIQRKAEAKVLEGMEYGSLTKSKHKEVKLAELFSIKLKRQVVYVTMHCKDCE
jgi:hypothetical protein